MGRRFGARRVAAFVAALALLVPFGAPPAAGVEPTESGIVCTSGDANPTFHLVAGAGNIGTPDGNTIRMWSYAADPGAFQFPGPTLCVVEDAVVTVVLRNELDEPVSIVFPGQAGVLAGTGDPDVTPPADPVAPQFDGGNLVSLVQSAAPGATVNYRFVASSPGTYLYESGTNPAKQVQMGLYGGLVVRPAGQPSQAYAEADTAFNPSTEYLLLMSEVDPALHQAVERGLPYDPSTYHPRYWMLNGRSFPDTLAPNGSPLLPTQPYSSLIHMEPRTDANPLPALVRYVNVGTRSHPFHPHGNHGRIIARDGRLLRGPSTQDLSYEKFLVNIGGGQTWDALYDWRDTELWTPSHPIPVDLPQPQDAAYKDDVTWYAGSPYLGYTDDLPVGVTSFNECGEYYHMWHSHALNEAANYEAAGGGMMTLQRIDPPGGCPPAP
jgi:FtsP/CotA-like multicopper oxidase with cupredoxin domain